MLRKGSYAERVGAGEPVYLAAVMEYLATSARVGRQTLPVTTRRPVSSLVTCSWPYPQRRRVEQTSLRCHHRSRRCLAQHPGRLVAQEDRQARRGLNL